MLLTQVKNCQKWMVGQTVAINNKVWTWYQKSLLEIKAIWECKQICFNNVQQSMMLLSSEAEWVTLSEAVKEDMCMIQLLRSMKILAKLPVMVRADNVGAILEQAKLPPCHIPNPMTPGINMQMNMWSMDKSQLFLLSLLKMQQYSHN